MQNKNKDKEAFSRQGNGNATQIVEKRKENGSGEVPIVAKASDRCANDDQKVQDQLLKRETSEDEIDVLAKKIRLDNEYKMKQLNAFAIFSNQEPVEAPTTEEKSEDWTSVQGQFGWAEVANTTIPYLTRLDNKYVSLRMAENKIFIKYKNAFTDEVRSCFRVKILHATTAEAALLNEINFRHCDNFYGKLEFTMGDAMVSLADLKEMYEFLNFCYIRLVERVFVSQNRCGFIKISGQNCVPYVWHEGKQYVPLFYFEGECRYLEERRLALCGWPLAYLKLYCKIQGIRRSLYDEEYLHVVDVELVKKFFPPETIFELAWPSECRVECLVQRPVPKLVFSQVPDKTKQPEQSKDVAKKPAVCVENNGLVTQRKQVPIAPVTHQPNGVNNFRTIQPWKAIPPPNSTPVQTTHTTAGTNCSLPTQPALIPTHNRMPAPNHAPPSFQKAYANSVMTRPNHPFKPIQVGSIATGGAFRSSSSRILQITDVVYNNAYFVVKIPVEKKQLPHCINMEPFITTNLLVLLEDIAVLFQVSLHSVINAVNVMHLDIFLPNKMQKKELEKYKVTSTRGMLRIQDFFDHLPQLKYILRAKN